MIALDIENQTTEQQPIVNSITYEQPLNEHMRICLRLEDLLNQLNNHVHDTSVPGSQMAMSSLVKILNVIDRPDLKSKLSQMLTQQATTLAQLKHLKQVDTQKLDNILLKLDELANLLHQAKDKIGYRLRSNSFLNQIRAQLNNPAGASNFSAPAFALWLKQPSSVRIAHLTTWSDEFKQLDHIIKTLLQLTRDSSPAQSVIAENGFYQQSFDPALPCQMIRITLPVDKSAYPEISVGKHRMVIRFLEPHYLGEPASQIRETLDFKLSCCRI